MIKKTEKAEKIMKKIQKEIKSQLMRVMLEVQPYWPNSLADTHMFFCVLD